MENLKRFLGNPGAKALVVAAGFLAFSYPFMMPRLAESPEAHFWYLYVMWGVGIVILAVLSRAERPDEGGD